ncbi:MAG: class I SAM-dependent methyltransferase [Acidobacteriota bacterium]
MPIIPPGGTRDMRPEVLPPSLLTHFNDDFVRSCDLLEEYVERTALGILVDLGVESVLPATVDGVVDRLRLDAGAARVPVLWLLSLLADRGHLERAEGDTFLCPRPLPPQDPDEIRRRQEEHDPSALPSYDIAAFAAESYPTCLRGEVSGERALFAPQRLAHWSRYFNNANPLYAINNRLPAMAAADGGSVRSILELGGGLGSGGEALLGELRTRGRLDEVEQYRFTDISPVFLRRGQRALAAAAPDVPLVAGRLDIDKPLEEQGVEPASVDLLFAVNTVHVARDLGATLGDLFATLAPGGRLVMGEGIRPFAGQAIYSELVFLLLESFRNPVLHPDYRPAGSFLTPEQWTLALESAGFVDVELLPDITRVREHYPSFLVASVSARKA